MPQPAPKPKAKGRKKRTPEVEATLQDPAVQKWFSKLSEGSRRTYSEHFPPFILWLRTQPRLDKITPSGLLRRQFRNKRKKPTERNPTPEYEVVDFVERWVAGLPDRYSTKKTKGATVWSFFKYNRCPLPYDASLVIRSDREPTRDVLTYEDIKQAISAAKLRDKSHMLVRFQGLMDTDAVDYVNRKLSDDIVSGMRAGKEVIRLSLPGRKRVKNIKPFDTYIGKDAIQCLRKYFDTERGWPAPGEAIWLNKFGRPYARTMYGENYLNLLRLQGRIPKPNGRLDARFGMNLHEWRDQTITYLHTSAKRHGFDMDVAQFISGHTNLLDPNKYDKFMNDKAYTEEQYRIAEPFLNIESNPEGIVRSKVEELGAKLEKVEKKLRRGDSLETIIEEVEEMRDTLQAGWLLGSGGVGRSFAMPPTALVELNEILAILKNPKSTRLDVRKAEERFEKIKQKASTK
jgi:hypothetical protein